MKDVFHVWCPAYGHTEDWDGEEVTAYDVDDAVCEWAEERDQETADYSIASGDSVVVHVRDSEDKLHKRLVTGEFSATYYSYAAPAAESEKNNGKQDTDDAQEHPGRDSARQG